jgi:hypothetical protein
MNKRIDAIAKNARRVGVMRRALLGLTVLLAASTAALADTTKLVCHLGEQLYKEDGPTIIELNEAQSSVVVHFGGSQMANPPGVLPPRTIGPVPAVFGTDAITIPEPSYPEGSFVLNRLTGDLIQNVTNWKWTCQPGKKLF